MVTLHLTKPERDFINHAACMHGLGWALLTSRTNRLSTARRLIAKGLVERAGPVVIVDGDGFHLEPERWREGFELTPAGHDVNEELERAEQERIDRLSAEEAAQ